MLQGLGRSRQRLGREGKSRTDLWSGFVCRLTVDRFRVNDLDGLLIGVSDSETGVTAPDEQGEPSTDRLFSEDTRGDTDRRKGRDLLPLCSLLSFSD